MLDVFLEKKITHLVYAGDGAVQYKPFEKAIKENDESHYGDLRLNALFGDTKGHLDWRINSYRDGSGSWQALIPFQSEEGAREAAMSITNANVDAQLAAARRAATQKTHEQPIRTRK